ncbi:MAG: LAGLIDADG family homing endonuclease [Candidatus Daviesbacteria bacterium]|nr:LAGLIDADG family homing endonuclease [Candidatus Daviesbacteria bacterium]
MFPSAQKDPRGGHNKSFINHTFFQTWSPSMAYILGFIFADGAIEDVQKSSRTCYIQITSKDACILEKIKKAMNCDHKLYIRFPRKIIIKGKKHYITSYIFNLRVGNKLMYNDLLKLGVTPRKSLTAKFPKISTIYLSYFLRGYFDGDGCLYLRQGKYPRLIFTSGSLRFLKSLDENITQKLSLPHGSINTSSKESQNPCYQLYYPNKSTQKILKFMYQNLHKAPYLERKFSIYQKYLNQNH